MTDETGSPHVGHDEFAEFRAEMKERLRGIEEKLRPLTEFLLVRSGEEEKARAVEKRVYKLELALADVSTKVNRIWLGAAGVVALIEILRLLPPGVLDRIFGR